MLNVLKDAKETEQHIQDKNKVYVDKHHPLQHNIDVGTEVMVSTQVLSNAAKGVTSEFIVKRDLT